MDIKGTVTIVTGSSSGIGAATVRRLASKGGNVVVNYSRSEGPARKVAEECEAMGAEVLVCRADVSDDADCKRLARETMDKWGRIDGLVNNAGTTKFVDHTDLDGLSADDFLGIYRVNLVGPYQMIRAVAPHMKAGGRGGVVNVSSIAGVMGTGSSIAYAASKGALNTMTLSLARSLGPEIRINTVCPGFVAGDWLRQGLGAERYDNTLANLKKNNALANVATPETVAQAIVGFLENADLVTGEFMMVDGGGHLGAVPLRAR